MIRVKNIYYMLSYAYQKLSQIGYSNISVEEYKNVQNLLAAILIKGIATQLREGLTNDYETVSEICGTPRGKINFAETVRYQTLRRHKVSCEYGVYSENNIFNQILKSTILLLIRSRYVEDKNKRELKKLNLYFSRVDTIDCKSINWTTLGYKQNSKSYRLLMNMCYLVVNGLLLTNESGTYSLAEYLDDQQMHKLYEKFILAYYQKEHPEFYARASYIDWNSDDGYIDFLPQMKSDILLSYQGRILIIDAKYYSQIMVASQYGNKETMRSAHMYQIFAYVKNYDKDNSGNVNGMLLYAGTDEETIPDYQYKLSGNVFTVRSLDLNTEWSEIVEQLELIADGFVSGLI